METGIKVGDLMTRNFVFVKPSTKLSEAAKLMIDKRIGSLVVKENQELRGMLTERDIIWAIAKGKKLSDHVSKTMSKRVVTIEPNRDVSHALHLMKKKKIRWLPVTVKKKVIGLLTMKDVLKIRPALFDITTQHMNIAEEKQKKIKVKTVNNERWSREGPCPECGVYDLLYKVDERYICESCKKKGR